MELISGSELQTRLEALDWLSLSSGRIVSTDKARWHSIEYGPGGITSANMADFVLASMFPRRIDSGLMYVRGFFPPEPPQVNVLRDMLNLPEITESEYKYEPLCICLKSEYMKLLAIMSWCLACSFDFYFIEEEFEVVVKGSSDEILSVLLPEKLANLKHVSDKLAGLPFKCKEGVGLG